MALDLKLIGIGMVIVFIAVFSILFVVDYIARLQAQCDINKNLEVCKLGTAKTIVVVLLLIAGGLLVVVAVTAYILISSQTTGKTEV